MAPVEPSMYAGAARAGNRAAPPTRRRAGLGFAVAMALAVLTAPGARAACPSDADAAVLAAQYLHRELVPDPPPGLSMDDALCGREKFVRFVGRDLGRVVGYKAGLTNPAVQKRFNHDAPVRGTLFAAMLRPDGAHVPAAFGARPVFEADLVVEVADAGIHDAATPLQVLRHVRRIHPFIEMPDLLLKDPSRISGASLTYANVAARLGVLGAAFTLPANEASVRALADMTVRLVDGQGQEIDRGSGSAILGHPLLAAIWLARDLKAHGITLRRGDLLSLGSFTRLLPPKAGTSAKAIYEGLPGTPSVQVHFD